MHGQTETTLLPRSFASAMHALAVLVAGWLLTRDGALSPRDGALLACSAVYWARATFGMLVLLKRRFAWSEAVMVTGLFGAIHPGMAWLGSGADGPLGVWDGVALVAYAVGSWLNTGSEYGRHVWKKDPAHRGRLYTEGLFRHAMHINYFGDTVLFTAFAALTGSPWALVVPVVMTVGFVVQHIPALDAYLAERYGEEFDEYAARTRMFVPWVW